jgi:hypothetical protein
MVALFNEFTGNTTMVAGTNDFIGVELTLDPFEEHEDGRARRDASEKDPHHGDSQYRYFGRKR